MPFPRAAGILLHPTSLPSRGGIGDFGPAAYEFVDFLASARQGLWQVLPLGPVGFHNTPYSSSSAFAGSPALISLERLADRGWIARDRLISLPDGGEKVDYEQVAAVKIPLIREAAKNFLNGANGSARSRYENFCRENSWWLDDFVLFNELQRRYQYASWKDWPREIARREPAALEAVRADFASAMEINRVVQFVFFEQWQSLRRYCAQRGILIIGDVAIFVNYESADVWTNPDIFQLDENLAMINVSGVPPDAFSETGQRWGNPLYRWDVLRQRGHDWWVRRMGWALHTCDIIRIDHFRGFEKYWEIPAHEPTAVNGRWVNGPNHDLFNVLRERLGELPFIAEDLGYITPEVHRLRDDFQMPGMKVLQFGFGDPGAHIYLPHRYEPNCVVYTGTHDNDTTVGWWQNGASAAERRAAEAYLGKPEDGIHWAFIRAAQGSVANLCVVPLQDALGLGSEARMNVPSRLEGNWAWRYRRGELTPELAQKLASLAETCDRDKAPALIARQQSEREVREEFAA